MLKALLQAACALALLAPFSSADFVASGRIEYQDRPFTFNGGFSSSTTTFLPVRLARVQIVNASSGSTLATGSTDASGNFSINVSGNGTANLLVRCFSRSDAFGNNRIRVTNTSNSLYSVDSSTFFSHNLNTNLNAGTIQALKLTTGSLQGSPFNMLDQMVWGIQYILNSGGSALPSSIRMQWPGGSGSFASGTVATMSDDDGFDDCVQLHELGHVLHNVYSDSDSPGGSHSFGQSNQDPRLSFGEGWASFFGASVRQFAGINDPGIYMDCSGTSGGGIQLRARFENASPWGNTTGGEADEVAVSCVLWDIVDRKDTLDTSVGSDDDALDGSVLFAGQTPDAKHWQVFTGPVKSASNLTIRNMWDGFFAPLDSGNLSTMQTIFSAFDMRFVPDAAEPNNSIATAVAITPTSSFGPTRTLYFATSPAGAPGDGDVDYFKITLAAGTTFEAETRYPGGNNDAETYADPRLDVFRANGNLMGSDDNSGTDRNALVQNLLADVDGDYFVRVSTNHSYRKTGSYELRVRTTFVPVSPPVVTSLTPDTVNSVSVDSIQQVFINGSGFIGVSDVRVDGQTLAGFPPQFFAINDSQIQFTMPTVSKLGPVTIDVVGASGTTQTTINVVPNSPPVIEMAASDPSFIIQSSGLTLTASGQPGDIVYVVASPSNLPTNLPGIVDLAIGNQYTSIYILGIYAIGPAGLVKQTYPLSGLPSGLKIHAQTASLLGANGFALPATTSNVQTGTVLF